MQDFWLAAAVHERGRRARHKHARVQNNIEKVYGCFVRDAFSSESAEVFNAHLAYFRPRAACDTAFNGANETEEE
jgi:hypothetical protein